MSVRKVTINNMRSYQLYSANIHPDTTLIIGKNGSGKTTLLEAVYLSLRGTSFRGRDRDVIPHNHQQSEIKIEFESGDSRKVLIQTSSDGKASKQFTVADASSSRLAPKNKLPVVLFEPDELRLLTSSPQRRRDFIDGIIARLSPTYSAVLNRFQRTLLQRNELLKQFESMSHVSWESHLFAWDVKLAELSASIIKARRNFIIHTNEHLSRLYSSLANSEHLVTAQYACSVKQSGDGLQQALLQIYESTRQSDALRGFTSTGPHRDDVEIYLDDHPASQTASRGEMRTIMLAFKLLEVELQEHHSGQKPLILLDDVFSELDSQRELALIESLSGYQTIITATDIRQDLISDSTVIEL